MAFKRTINRKVIFTFYVIFGICGAFLPLANKTLAQSIIIKDSSSGLLALGGIGTTENMAGPLFSLGYSINGHWDLGIAYGRFAKSGDKVSSVALSSSILFAKQYDGNALNFELIPSLQRTHSNADAEIYQTSFSLGIALSRDIAASTASSNTQILPRVSIIYGNYFIDNNNSFPSKGVLNKHYSVLSAELILGFHMTSGLKFALSPGITYNDESESVGLALAGGFLF